MTPRDSFLIILAGLVIAFLPFTLSQMGIGPGASATWISLFTVPIAGAMILGGLIGLIFRLMTQVFSQGN